MPGYPAHNGSVLIVDLTLNQSMAENAVIFCGRDGRFQVCRRVEAGLRKIECGEDLTPAKLVQSLAGKLFQRLTQQDEADITVFRTRARCGGEWDAESLLEQIVLIMGGLKQLDVGGQA